MQIARPEYPAGIPPFTSKAGILEQNIENATIRRIKYQPHEGENAQYILSDHLTQEQVIELARPHKVLVPEGATPDTLGSYSQFLDPAP